jgi:hypothetical protein
MAPLHCKHCDEPYGLEGSAFWAEPSGSELWNCSKCGASLRLESDSGKLPSSPQPGEIEELSEAAFSALSGGIIATKRLLGPNGTMERDAQEFARALIRAGLMDAVSDAPPSSRDEEVTVVIGPVASRAKRAALAKMAADREAALSVEQELTISTPPPSELLEIATAAPEVAPTLQSSSEAPERRMPTPPPRPEPLSFDEILEEIEAAPVSDGGTPSLQALIGHPVEPLPHATNHGAPREKSRVPKPPERQKLDSMIESEPPTAEAAAAETNETSDRFETSDLASLAPTNVTAPPVHMVSSAPASAKSRWAAPLSFAALGSLFAVLIAIRTPKSDTVVAEEAPPAIAAAAVPTLASDEPTNSAPLATEPALAPVEAAAEPAPALVETTPAAVTPTPGVEAPPAANATLVKDANAAKPRPRPKAKTRATEPFDASAASASLAAAQARASSCRKADDPSGVAQVSITFAPSGRVTQATVAGPPFAGTPTGGCVASTLRSARVPAFVGEPVTVRKTVTIQ